MKRRFQRVLSILAAVTFVLTTFSVSVLATETRVDGRLNGNELFDEWSKTAREAEAQRLLADTEKTLDQQGSFEAAVRRMREIESAHAGGYLEREEISTGLNMGDSEPIGTPEEAWERFVQNKMRTSGLDEKAIQEEYELRIFTDEAFAGEERFAIYSSDNVVSDGWQEDSGNPGKWRYLENGKRVYGWKYIVQYWYYFGEKDDPDNYMYHGWLPYKGAKYFMGRQGLPETGRMYTDGWMNDTEAGGTAAAPLWYYLDTSTGKMLHGWLTYKGEKYYLGVPGDASSGLMYDKGWMKESGKWYYIGSDGIMKTEWLTLGSGTFYLGIDGQMQTGWQTISGSRYYFNSNGQMQTGWQTIDQKTYYFRSGGTMVTGSYILDGTTYLFDSLGVCINRNPPTTMNNMTYNFTFYQETSNPKIIQARDNIMSQFYYMGYESQELITGKPADTYANWPYDKATIIHGHGLPGRIQYITKYEDDDDQKSALSYNWLFSSRDWTYTGNGRASTISSSDRVIGDYVQNQLDNNLFTIFVSCYSARNLENVYASDNVTVTGTRTVSRNFLEATIGAGGKCALGFYYTVVGGEYFAEDLVRSLFLGNTIQEAIDSVNSLFILNNNSEGFPSDVNVHGEICYNSPYDPRNQICVGDTSTRIASSAFSNTRLLAENSNYQIAQNHSLQKPTNESEYRISTRVSSKRNLISGPDATISYNVVVSDGKEYYYDDAGRIILIFVKEKETQPITEELPLNLLEECAREFLSQNGVENSNYYVSDAIPNIIGHHFIFEDGEGTAIHVSMYNNGRISWAGIGYGNTFNITETDRQYFEEKMQEEMATKGKTDVISNQSVSYQKINGILYATYNLTYRDANGLYYCEEMVFGK